MIRRKAVFEICPIWYTKELCRANPDSLYVFGDNTARTGYGGQAAIRNQLNSFGIATKRYPRRDEQAYFTNDFQYLALIDDEIERLLEEAMKYDVVYLPRDGLGTGLSELPARAPMVYAYLALRLSALLGSDYCTNVVLEGITP